MTLARTIATGRGKLRARLEIEGWPIQLVTHRAMEQTLADGRQRVDGLKFGGMKLAARFNLPTGKIEAEGFRVQVEDAAPSAPAIRGLRRKPSVRTYLSEYVSASATTIPVFSTARFPSSGVIHINTEAIRYAGKTATSFTGCIRGSWNTAAQAHFAPGTSASVSPEAEEGGIGYPPVTDVPAGLEGRRAWLYLYGDGDRVDLDGAQRWQGVCRTAPRFEGRKASFSIEPPTAILEQQVGGDVATPVGIRGIYYPWSAPFLLQLTRGATGERGTALASTESVLVRVIGFYETQEAFAAAVSSAVATATAAWSADVTVRATSSGFELVYLTASSSPRWIEVNSATSSVVGDAIRAIALDLGVDRPLQARWRQESTDLEVEVVSTSTRYVYSFGSPVPRAYFGRDTPWVRRGLADATGAATAPAGRVYLGGLFVPTTEMLLGDPESARLTRITSVGTASERWVNLGEQPTFYVFDGSTRWRAGRLLARGNVGALVEALVSASPGLANSGAMPLVRAGDIDVTSADIDAGIITPAVSDRAFLALGQDATIGDVMGPELVAAGMHWTLSTSGQLQVRRARLAAETEAGVFVLDVDPSRDGGRTPVGGMPTLEEAAIWGFISDVAYLTGYDPFEDEHTGPEVRFVNVSARAPNRLAKTLEIAQTSVPGVRVTWGGPQPGLAGEPTQEQIATFAKFWGGLLGGSYDVVSMRVPGTLFDARLGDAVQVSSRYLVGDDGELGVSGKLGILIGFSWDLDSLSGTIELLCHSRPIGGYAPEFLLTAQTNTSGNTWALTLDVAAETGQALSTWYRAGDLLQVVEYDSSSPETYPCTVVSVTDDTSTVTVTFDAAWDPKSVQWTIRPRASDEQSADGNQGRFVYVASDEALVTFSGGGARDAKVFGP